MMSKYKKEREVLIYCFKKIINYEDFDRYCEFWDIEDREKEKNRLRKRGYKVSDRVR